MSSNTWRPALRRSTSRLGGLSAVVDQVLAARVDRERLRRQISDKYTDVALVPEKGFHFHTGRPLARMLGYVEADVDWLPTTTVESFAGTGNPLSIEPLAD